MIEVQDLTNDFGSVRAIDNVSFRVERGEILGFLGPNGAGKTTAMRIISGFFPATSGSARVAGFDVFQQPLKVKRRIGYLPENPPLYPEMTAEAYLRFVARIKGVRGKDIASRIEYVVDRCALADVRKRLIKHLSKGFRQRVGLAQALVHDPEVLILDEPTVGLDPKQIIEVRELIKSLGGDHTVILSTHILPEVSVTCERVVIINNGSIVAIDTPQNLTSQLSGGDRIEVEVSGGPAITLPGVLAQLEGVTNVTLAEPHLGHDRIWVESEADYEIRPQVVRALIEQGFDVYQIKSRGMSLEEIFLKLTTDEETPGLPGMDEENSKLPDTDEEASE